MLNSLRNVVQLSFSNGIPRRSLIVAIVVGTVLTLINQGPIIFSGKQPVWWKVGLTYIVPYLVASYGAVSSQLSSQAEASIQQDEEQESDSSSVCCSKNKFQNKGDFVCQSNPLEQDIELQPLPSSSQRQDAFWLEFVRVVDRQNKEIPQGSTPLHNLLHQKSARF
eukprot:TRINITY_DN12228_c0_g1_i1.p4 TRINITY_DN12228_c0_g1~~TRINITY_DN12228_c0_g1_i1.p4  ORF type:complete len:166 (+),score=3.01 TRINITY_DN12228_c0_g1_i1:468-965(+)